MSSREGHGIAHNSCAFQDRMVCAEIEFRLLLQMASETGGRILAGIG